MGEWININVRLPKQYQRVIVYDDDYKCVSAAMFTGTGLFIVGDEYETEAIKVTYWMPYPDPPNV